MIWTKSSYFIRLELAVLFLLIMPALSSGQTLREMLKQEGIDFKSTRQADLEKNITSGYTLDDQEARTLATYVDEGDHFLSETLYLFRFHKLTRKWSAAELKWPESSDVPSLSCGGGSIVDIHQSKDFIYLHGHINPSAACTMVITKDLKFYDAIYGWVVGIFADESVVYYHSQVHFASTHYVELSIYTPHRQAHKQVYPMKPHPEIRRQYLTKVQAAYEKCCVETPPPECGVYFRNHHGNAELFNHSLKSPVAINDATNALAFVAVFADSVMEQGKIVSEHIEVVYIYRNVTNGRKMEYREFLLYDLRKKYGDLALSRYLEPMMLQKLFSQQ